MSLIRCPECNKEISSTINSCIHCGYNIKSEGKRENKVIPDNQHSDNMNSVKRLSLLILVVILLLWGISSVPQFREAWIAPVSNQYSAEEMIKNDPYQVMSNVFVGNPDKESIKALITGIIKMYKLPDTNDQAEKIGNMALSLRKKSIIGFTEMDLLKHIFQNGDPSTYSLPDQAGISSVILDKGW